MSNNTNVPQPVFTPTGLTIPDDSTILAGVFADYDSAFGGNLNLNLNTPQGQLASSTTAVISDAYALFGEFVNQVNPDTADGFMQDAIARIYFLTRSPGSPTSVECQCIGAQGTQIPAGAQAQDTSGNRYVCVDGGIIPVGGTITLQFAAIVDGPNPCPANTLTTIYQALPGWDTINNSADGVPGTLVESRAAFEFRRQQSVALNAHGSLPSIYGAVFEVDNVTDVYVTENTTNSTVNTGSTAFPLVAHSLYVAVVGGDNNDIAQAIWTKKDVGCDYNGNTSVTVTDPSGYVAPLPSYTVKFERPTAVPIKFAVEIANSGALPSNIIALTQQAIIDAFNGADSSGSRVRVGSLILASKFYAPVSAIGPEVSILSILLGKVTATLTNYQAGIDEAPTVTATDITVTLV